MKKKVLALLLATAMISTFVACGKEETTLPHIYWSREVDSNHRKLS